MRSGHVGAEQPAQAVSHAGSLPLYLAVTILQSVQV